MNENLKKLASEAVNLQKKIKADTEKLQNIKKEIISKSSGANSSFAINLIVGKVRVIRSKKLKTFLLNKKKFSSLSIQLKKKLVRNKVVKLSYLINTEVYTQLLNDGLVDDELKNLVDEKKRQPFYISIFLNKKEQKEIPKENEFEEILEAAESESSSEDEIDIIDPADDLFIKSVFSDDESEEISETEKEEKGFD
tara:strand:+ start:449 stop:1036 length:588 start_codon:yes stop_codon:yes gene_type:complete